MTGRPATVVRGRIRRAPGSVAGEVVGTARHPATWAFASAYGVAAVTLAVTGNMPTLAVELGLAAFLAALLLATVALTAPTPAAGPDGDVAGEVGVTTDVDPGTSRRVWPQLGVLTVVVLATLYGGMVFNGTAPRLPGLYAGTSAVYRLTTLLLNPILYVVVPASLLLLLGARPRALGLGPGRRAWTVAALWSAGPAVAAGIALVSGAASPARLLRLVAGDTLQNGPMEEFLWRGAVLTRLRAVVGTAWGVVLSSLTFGLWHLGTNLRAFDGRLAPALAYCVVSQGTLGLALALLFVRTRNLAAPSVAHVALDVASRLLG